MKGEESLHYEQQERTALNMNVPSVLKTPTLFSLYLRNKSLGFDLVMIVST